MYCRIVFPREPNFSKSRDRKVGTFSAFVDSEEISGGYFVGEFVADIGVLAE